MAFGKTTLTYSPVQNSVFLLKNKQGDVLKEFLVPQKDEELFIQDFQSKKEEITSSLNQEEVALIQVRRI